MEIVIILDYKNYFRQSMYDFQSINLDKFKEVFNKNGYKVSCFTYEEIANHYMEIESSIIIYTSSENGEYRSYIEDILYILSKKNKLVPKYEIVRAHENKGFQELYKKQIGLKSLDYKYFANLRGLINYSKEQNIKFPLILKEVFGAGSTNVFKIDSMKQLEERVKKLSKPRNFLSYIVKKMVKKYLLKRKYVHEYYEEDIFFGRFILQQFVDNLQEDWKVLVFGEKYYVLNRKVRDNDFRASGSGKLSFVEPPVEVLNYARYVFQMLDTPVASLDICFDGQECYLIEFQGTHFGPYTIINSSFYYTLQNGKWQKIVGRSDYEVEYAQSIVQYLKHRVDSN